MHPPAGITAAGKPMLEDIFRRFLSGEISAPIATMQILLANEMPADAIAAIEAASDARLRELTPLLAGCEDVARTIAAVREDDAAAPAGPADAVARNRQLFDRLVAQSPEASVALYSLGRPDLLDQATHEIVRVLRAWGLLGEGRRVLDLGCGIGRVTRAIAPELAGVVGIDISEAMIAEARRRCAGLGSVELRPCSGMDLSGLGDAVFDLVLAVDSFPYLVEAGDEIVARHFAEARRVLAPSGDFLIFNFSYRGRVEQDAADVAALAAAHGFVVVRSGERPFTLWDGVAFHVRQVAGGKPPS